MTNVPYVFGVPDDYPAAQEWRVVVRVIALINVCGLRTLEMQDRPLPKPMAGEVRIRVLAVSFNPVDIQLRQGSIPLGEHPGADVLGRDLSGVVDAIGPGVSNIKVGARIYAYVARLGSTGTFAEYVCVPAELLAIAPRCLSAAQAAAVPVAGLTAMLALASPSACDAKSALVTGASGGVGGFALSLCLARGMNVFCAVRRASSVEYLVTHFGVPVQRILDCAGVPGGCDFQTWSDGLETDLALDFVGRPLLDWCCSAVRRGGHVASTVDSPGPDGTNDLFERNATFHAVGAHAASLSTDRRAWAAYSQMLRQWAVWLDTGYAKMPSVEVVGEFSCFTVDRAHSALSAGGHYGKLVMLVTPE